VVAVPHRHLHELLPVVGATSVGSLALGEVGGEVIGVLILDLGGAAAGGRCSGGRGSGGRRGGSRGAAFGHVWHASLGGLALGEVGGEVVGVLVLDLGGARHGERGLARRPGGEEAAEGGGRAGAGHGSNHGGMNA
jgi:hypothetical protein